MNKTINIDQDLYNLVIGWNVICPKKDVLLKNILDENKILEDGIFYESNHDTGYKPVRKLYQNIGYWVKATKEGSLKLSYSEDIISYNWGDTENKEVIDIVFFMVEFEAETSTYDEITEAIIDGNSFYANIVNPFDFKTNKDNIFKKFSYYYKQGYRFFLSWNYSSILGALNESFNKIYTLDADIDLSQVVFLDTYSTAFNLLNTDSTVSRRNRYINRLLPNDNLQIKIMSDKVSNEYKDYDEIVCLFVNDAYGMPFKSYFEEKFGNLISFSSYTETEIEDCVSYLNENGVSKNIYVILVVFSNEINQFLDTINSGLNLKLLFAETFAFSDTVLYDEIKFSNFYNYRGEFIQFIGTNPSIINLKNNFNKNLKPSTHTILTIDALKMMYNVMNLKAEINNNHRKFEAISNNFYGFSGLCRINSQTYDRDILNNYTCCMVSSKTILDKNNLNDPFPYIITEILQEGGKITKIGEENTDINYQFENRNYFFTNYYNYNLEVSKDYIPSGKTIDSIYGLGEISYTIIDEVIESNYRKANSNSSISQISTMNSIATQNLPFANDFTNQMMAEIQILGIQNLWVSNDFGSPMGLMYFMLDAIYINNIELQDAFADKFGDLLVGNLSNEGKILLNTIIYSIQIYNGSYPNALTLINYQMGVLRSDPMDSNSEYSVWWPTRNIPELISLMLEVSREYYILRGFHLYPADSFINDNINHNDFSDGLRIFTQKGKYPIDIEIQHVSNKHNYSQAFGFVKILESYSDPSITYEYSVSSEESDIIMSFDEILFLPSEYERSNKIFYIKGEGEVKIIRDIKINNIYMGFFRKKVEIKRLDDLEGCTNNVAINYNKNATLDNGSCILPIVISDFSIEDDSELIALNNGKINLFNITGGSGNFSYTVYLNDNLVEEGSTNSDINIYNLVKGIYQITITDSEHDLSLEVLKQVNLIEKQEEIEPIIYIETAIFSKNWENGEITVSVDVNTKFPMILVSKSKETNALIIYLTDDNFVIDTENNKITLTYTYNENSVPSMEENLDNARTSNEYDFDNTFFLGAVGYLWASYVQKEAENLSAYSDYFRVKSNDDQNTISLDKTQTAIAMNELIGEYDGFLRNVDPMVDMLIEDGVIRRTNFSEENKYTSLGFEVFIRISSYSDATVDSKNTKFLDPLYGDQNFHVIAIPSSIFKDYLRSSEGYSLHSIEKFNKNKFPTKLVKINYRKFRIDFNKYSFKGQDMDLIIQIIKTYVRNDKNPGIKVLGTYMGTYNRTKNEIYWTKFFNNPEIYTGSNPTLLFDGFYNIKEPTKNNIKADIPKPETDQNNCNC